MRIDSSKLAPPTSRGKKLSIVMDGESLTAFEGETVAAVLIANGRLIFRRTRNGSPRGVYCGIGLCQECRMVINGIPNVRACTTQVEPNMVVKSQDESECVDGAPRADRG
jgi:predicted molibdopterin-dependent oxidoreductase YjgC